MDYSVGARYGILPRHAKSEKEIIWFTTPSHYVFHFVNSWEEINDQGYLKIFIYLFIYFYLLFRRNFDKTVRVQIRPIRSE